MVTLDSSSSSYAANFFFIQLLACAMVHVYVPIAAYLQGDETSLRFVPNDNDFLIVSR